MTVITTTTIIITASDENNNINNNSNNNKRTRILCRLRGLQQESQNQHRVSSSFQQTSTQLLPLKHNYAV